jgi:pre-mRNA-splicing factor ATP-dependent RNA helicase DHX15/PRP43
MDIINNFINDILDSEGKGNNFITNKPYSDEFKVLAKAWSKLPLYTNKKQIEKFFNLIDSNNVLLIISGTGSGKTVLVGKYLLRYFLAIGLTKKIAMTNPKIITTVNNAKYSAKCLDVELGHEVGYNYSNAPEGSHSDETKLLYVTDGIILASLFSGDKYLSNYQGIIIDEAHERQLNIDLLLSLLKEVVKNRPDFKLIIMSATIDSTVFKKYYNVEGIKYAEMEVSGQPNFPIASNWLDTKASKQINAKNFLDYAVKQAIEILENTTAGDIIVFITSQNEAKKGCTMLKDECPNQMKMKRDECSTTFCIEVSAQINDKQKELAVSKDLYKVDGFKRKIIFATNVAESSITFDGLVYVIESGYELRTSYNPEINAESINRERTSQAQVKQRVGRTGRTQNGIAYYLYTEKDFKKFNQFPLPGISLQDLTDTSLQMIKYSKSVKNMINLVSNMITPPNINQITSSLYKLYFIDAIKIVTEIDDKIERIDINKLSFNNIKKYDSFKNYNGVVTSVGYSILRFKQTPILSAYAIIISHYMNCTEEIIKIFAILDETNGQIGSLFKYSLKEEKDFIQNFKQFGIDGTDHLTLLNIYNDYYLQNKTDYLNLGIFNKIKNRIENLTKIADKIKEEQYIEMKEKYILIKIEPFKEMVDNIYYVLAISHYFNLLKYKDGKYTSRHYINNSTALGEFSKLEKTNNKLTDYAICTGLTEVFGKKSFKCITHIPDNIIKKITG